MDASSVLKLQLLVMLFELRVGFHGSPTLQDGGEVKKLLVMHTPRFNLASGFPKRLNVRVLLRQYSFVWGLFLVCVQCSGKVCATASPQVPQMLPIESLEERPGEPVVCSTGQFLPVQSRDAAILLALRWNAFSH